jgi:probable non-F420 flavinoid oxidoreductase
MTVYGFHASHEQIPPRPLLDAVRRAEEVGFRAAMCSDHLTPWSREQGESAFAWSWLGSALQATELPFGVFNAPGQRYHPVIIAQAAATLAAMYPGRFWAALGTGEAMNEHVTADPWPRKAVRRARLRECVDVMRALFAGEEVSHDGLVRVDRARLWTLPADPPRLLAGAVSVETARWAASWADGLITINQPYDRLRALTEAYRQAGGRGELVLQVHLSYAADDATALAIAYDQWRTNVFGGDLAWDLELPEQFEAAAVHVRPEAMHTCVRVSADPGRHAGWLQEYAELGFAQIYCHHVGQEQAEFLEVFGAKVLPQLTEAGS